MKIKIYIKSPDTLHEAIDDAVNEMQIAGLSEEEANAAKEVRREKCHEIASRWFEYSECVTLEMDTDEKTMIVLPKGL